jgi:hypothetical protein
MGRLFADFNSMTHDDLGERVLVGKQGSWQIEQYRPLNWLIPGATVKLSDGELEVSAVLEFDEATQCWFGRPDWATRRDLISAADGMEHLRQFSAEHRLIILKNELGLRIQLLHAGIELLTAAIANPSPEQGLSSIEAIASQLARSANELREVFDALTDPNGNGQQGP